MQRRVSTPLIAMLGIAALALAACNGGGNDDDATATPPPSPSAAATAAATVTPGLTPSSAIREVDLAAVADVQALAAESGGTFVQTDVLYADLTDDLAEEAIVPLSSGGTQGFVAFLVLTPDGDGTATLLEQTPPGGRGLTLEFQDDRLVMVEPAFGPTDPECCPSMLTWTTYGWNGAALAITDVQTVPNPGGGAKTPSVSP